MFKIDYKGVINPFILISLILILTYLTGFRDINLIYYSFITFLVISSALNLILISKKVINKGYYIYIYTELFFSLVFLVPLFFLVGVQNPIMISFFILGSTDFLIQAYYNLTPREDGKEIISLWKNKLIRSERRWLHPISMQQHIFKDFITEIIDSDKINPTRDHAYFDLFLPYRLKKSILTHQFAGKGNIIFSVNIRDSLSKRYNNLITSEKGFLTNKEIMNDLKALDKKISKDVITAFKTRYNMIRIIFKKDFFMKNNILVYDFLSKVYKKYQKPTISNNR